MLLLFSFLLVSAVLAIDFELSSNKTTIDCSLKIVGTPKQEPDWGPDDIYPVQVCVKFSDSLAACENEQPKLQLTVYIQEENNFDVLDDHEFSLSHIKSNEYCYVYGEQYIATKLQGRNLIDRAIDASVVLKNIRGEFQVFLRAASYIVKKTGPVTSVADNKHKLHSALCYFPNCVIQVEPPHSIAMISKFTETEFGTPQYEEGDAPLTNVTFSVTTVICESTCTPSFVAIASSTKPLILIVGVAAGGVVVAALVTGGIYCCVKLSSSPSSIQSNHFSGKFEGSASLEAEEAEKEEEAEEEESVE